MIGFPCKNPSCKSYGKPHPNCKCYMEMAEGGEVSFCSSHRMHESSCRHVLNDHNQMFKNMERPDVLHHHVGYLAHGGSVGLQNIDHENYEKHAKRGHDAMDKHISSVFQGEKTERPDLSRRRKTTDDWLEKGGISANVQNEKYHQNEPDENKTEIHTPFADKLPEHNLMLQASKANVANYLHGLKPTKFAPKLAFDSEPDETEKKRSYERALDIAVHPMSILHEIESGKIDPEHIQHFNAMYPELRDSLQQKLTKKITEDQLDGKKPSFKVRQGLSLLMGVPLSGEFQPQAIMAAQATFQTKNAPQQQNDQQQPKKKKSTTALSKSSQAFLTSNQAAASRLQKQ